MSKKETKKPEKQVYSKVDESKVRKSVAVMKGLITEKDDIHTQTFHSIRINPSRWNAYTEVSDEWLIDHAKDIHGLLMSNVSVNNITKAIVSNKGLKSLQPKQFKNSVNMIRSLISKHEADNKSLSDINVEFPDEYLNMIERMPVDIVKNIDGIEELIKLGISDDEISKAVLNGKNLGTLKFGSTVDEMYVIKTGKVVDVDTLGGTTVVGEVPKPSESKSKSDTPKTDSESAKTVDEMYVINTGEILDMDSSGGTTVVGEVPKPSDLKSKETKTEDAEKENTTDRVKYKVKKEKSEATKTEEKDTTEKPDEENKTDGNPVNTCKPGLLYRLIMGL